jgi:hypothetical protein
MVHFLVIFVFRIPTISEVGVGFEMKSERIKHVHDLDYGKPIKFHYFLLGTQKGKADSRLPLP